MFKSTPGPWVIDWNVSRLDIFSADGTMVASLRRSTLSAGLDDVAKANARLIAAAPDLLEALEETLQEALDWAYEAGVSLNDNEPFVVNARAAIAKARGKA